MVNVASVALDTSGCGAERSFFLRDTAGHFEPPSANQRTPRGGEAVTDGSALSSGQRLRSALVDFFKGRYVFVGQAGQIDSFTSHLSVSSNGALIRSQRLSDVR